MCVNKSEFERKWNNLFGIYIYLDIKISQINLSLLLSVISLINDYSSIGDIWISLFENLYDDLLVYEKIIHEPYSL